MSWLLRGLLALSLATAIAQGSAIVIQETMVAKVEPTPSVQPTPEPSEPLPSEEPSTVPSVVPSQEPTPTPDVEIDVDLPPLPPLPVVPVSTPAPVPTPPPVIPPRPVCPAPGGSAIEQATRTGWTAQGRECAGKQDATPLLVTFLAMMLLLKITDPGSMAPCLICGRGRDDPLHWDEERGGLAHDTTPRVEQHAYDPGERRTLIRRMADRIKRIEDVS